MSPQQLLDRLSDSGILSQNEIESLQRNVAAGKSIKDAEALSKELVRQKKLTPFQALELNEGKELVFGEYLVLDKIGAGGMGQVFKAIHRRMERIVALKVLHKGTGSSPDAVQRFHREVKAAAKLIHPNIVTAYDAGEQNGAPYLVMEYIEGSDLSARVKKHGPLSVDKAINCVVQAAKGLEFAHAAGVISRDTKPHNLLMDKKGVVKILDMGLARILSTKGDAPQQFDLTKSGAFMGTVDYLAPEQAMDARTADHRADIYSLGCTFYFLLTGKPIYEGETVMQRFVAHRQCPIPSLCDSNPDVSVPVDNVYRKMVAKTPEERYQSMREVIRAFQEVARKGPFPSQAASKAAEPKVEGVGQGIIEVTPKKQAKQGHAALWIGAFVVVLVLAIGGFFLSGVSKSKDKEEAAHKDKEDAAEKGKEVTAHKDKEQAVVPTPDEKGFLQKGNAPKPTAKTDSVTFADAVLREAVTVLEARKAIVEGASSQFKIAAAITALEKLISQGNTDLKAQGGSALPSNKDLRTVKDDDSPADAAIKEALTLLDARKTMAEGQAEARIAEGISLLERRLGR